MAFLKKELNRSALGSPDLSKDQSSASANQNAKSKEIATVISFKPSRILSPEG
jgi:hypothetical protein